MHEENDHYVFNMGTSKQEAADIRFVIIRIASIRGVASLFCSASNHTLERGSFFFTRCKMVRSEVFSWVN